MHLYSTSYSANQSEALPLRKTKGNKSSLERKKKCNIFSWTHQACSNFDESIYILTSLSFSFQQKPWMSCCLQARRRMKLLKQRRSQKASQWLGLVVLFPLPCHSLNHMLHHWILLWILITVTTVVFTATVRSNGMNTVLQTNICLMSIQTRNISGTIVSHHGALVVVTMDFVTSKWRKLKAIQFLLSLPGTFQFSYIWSKS